jgi:hypothetical protein
MENQFDQKLHKGVKEIRQIKLSAHEKERILEKIFSAPARVPVKSPYAKHWVVVLLPSFLLIVLLSGGAVFASGSSLPGSAFYPLKTKVVEPLGASLKFSQGAKAAYQSKLATKRLEEAEALADAGELDERSEDKLNSLLLNHTNALDKALEKMQDKKPEKKNDNKKEEDKIVNEFETRMNTHAAALEEIKVRHKKEGQNENNKISTTARESAEKIKNKIRGEERNEEEGIRESEDIDLDSVLQ